MNPNANAYEINFDGIVGPTHNYSGLSYGNIASKQHQFHASNPRLAALQGLEKMKFLADKGLKQAVLPPQERPFLPILRALGFSGSEYSILKTVYNQNPELLQAVCSAASMWTANAATTSPSADSSDHRVHLTAANLSNKFHRSLEASTTSLILKTIFKDDKYFSHHAPLPTGSYFSDEGAANHTRFCQAYDKSGIQLFTYGRSSFSENIFAPKHYPARQTKEASQAIARLHQLEMRNTVFAQQHPDAIDAGAFHNDVVAVGNKNVFFFHEQAYLNQDQVLQEIEEKVAAECKVPMIFLEVKSADISLKEAVSSYLFNSQLISLSGGTMALIAPFECQENPKIETYLNSLLMSSNNPIQEVYYRDLKQSMQNGGGPACLRFRVVLTQEEIMSAHLGVFLTDELYHQLKIWIQTNYRDKLEIKDLADPQLLDESYKALDELTKILNIGMIYPFQKS